MWEIAGNKLKYQSPSDKILLANGIEDVEAQTYHDAPDLRQNHQRQDQAGHGEFAGENRRQIPDGAVTGSRHFFQDSTATDAKQNGLYEEQNLRQFLPVQAGRCRSFSYLYN